MIRKSSVLMMAALVAALLPMAAMSQVDSPTSPTAEKVEPTYKWEAAAGYGYTSLNQVNESQSGLQGVEASITRDFSKHFGVIADGAYYKYAIKSGNPGTPSVEAVLFGPVVRASAQIPIFSTPSPPYRDLPVNSVSHWCRSPIHLLVSATPLIRHNPLCFPTYLFSHTYHLLFIPPRFLLPKLYSSLVGLT